MDIHVPAVLITDPAFDTFQFCVSFAIFQRGDTVAFGPGGSFFVALRTNRTGFLKMDRAVGDQVLHGDAPPSVCIVTLGTDFASIRSIVESAVRIFGNRVHW